MPANDEPEVALDECLDRLLIGADWSATLPEADRDAVRGLMDVAQKLLTIARQSPHLEGHGRQRLWGRVATPGRGPQQLAADLLAACAMLFRLLAGNELQTVEARERVRIRDVWR